VDVPLLDSVAESHPGDSTCARAEWGSLLEGSEATTLLCTIQGSTLGELKRICGAGGYVDAKKDFLQHRIFSHWLCDE
jgi:hypothetical protein